jgi:hypothetical protein
MKRFALLLLIFAFAAAAGTVQAATYYHEGRVVAMQSVPCGSQGASHHRTKQMLCDEYTIRTDSAEYEIAQTLPKKVNLLPVGHHVYFRVKKNQMFVRGRAENGKKVKDQQYKVISENQRGTMVPGSP